MVMLVACDLGSGAEVGWTGVVGELSEEDALLGAFGEGRVPWAWALEVATRNGFSER